MRTATALLSAALVLGGCAASGPPLPGGSGGVVVTAVTRQDEDVRSGPSNDPYEADYPRFSGAERYDYDRFDDLVVWVEGAPAASLPLAIAWTGEAFDPPLAAAGPGRPIRLVNRAARPVLFFAVDEATGEELDWPEVAAGASADVGAPGAGLLFVYVDVDDAAEAILYRAPGRAAIVASGERWFVGPLPPGPVAVGGWHRVLPAGRRTVSVTAGDYAPAEVLFSVDVLEAAGP